MQFIRSPWFWLAAGLVAVVFRGLFIDVMDVDASQYASISMEMSQNGSWLQVFHHTHDYLDKPPLLFWTSAFSMLCFGLSNWAYKLPSVLAAFAGVYAVYRFSRLYYDALTARFAAFILASCLGFILLCNDVRTDTLLMGMSACAVWMLAEYLRSARWLHLVGAFTFVGLAMLAKGPIGLVMPALAIGTQLLLQRDWRNLFRWQWLAGLCITALILVPMCWGLYQQFDLQPEKVVNGRTGVSGLYFYFWEQSFGRITGENVWKNDTTGLYFTHVYLWAFLPWSLLLIPALWQRLRTLVQQRLKVPAADEVISIGGFLLTFVALSMSKYKLPHYIFITLPWAAVLVARWLRQQNPVGKTAWTLAYLSWLIMLAGAFTLVVFVFPGASLGIWLPLLGLTGWFLTRMIKSHLPPDAEYLIQRGVLVSIITAFVLNFHFYPSLLPYQSTSTAMRLARAQGLPKDKIAFFLRHGHALDFYNGYLLTDIDSPGMVRDEIDVKGHYWMYTNQKGHDMLDSVGIPYRVTAQIPHFQVALLKPAFLNPATRTASLDTTYLLELGR